MVGARAGRITVYCPSLNERPSGVGLRVIVVSTGWRAKIGWFPNFLLVCWICCLVHLLWLLDMLFTSTSVVSGSGVIFCF